MEVNVEETKKDFSWKRYLVLVILSEIITIIFTTKICLDTRNSNDLSGLTVLPIWIVNGLIFFILSLVKIIKYKLSKNNEGKIIANVANVFVAIISSIMINIGVYFINLSIYVFIDMGIDFNLFFTEIGFVIFYLAIGIALIFPIFKLKE